jgi:hypothetical protein
MVAAISIAWPIATPYLENFQEIVDNAFLFDEGGGVFHRLMDLQNRWGGYLIAFVPKALHENFGLLARIDRFGQIGEDDNFFYNYTVVMGHVMIFFIVFTYGLASRRLRIDNLSFYLALIYVVFFATSPVYAPRYFYPAFILIVHAITSTPVAPPLARLRSVPAAVQRGPATA